MLRYVMLSQHLQNAYEGLLCGMHTSEDEIEVFRQRPIYPLMPLLQTGVLHRTSVEGLKGIRKIGYILPNKGQYPFTYWQTENSYGYSMGYISLFDFESAKEECCRRNHHNWEDFFGFCAGKPLTIVLKLNRRELAHKLIPNSERPKLGEKNYKSSIPFVEVWYPDKIPVTAIDCYIVTWQPSKVHEIVASQFLREEKGELDHLLSLPEAAFVQAIQKRSKEYR